MCLSKSDMLTYADGNKDYRGQRAEIRVSGNNYLPWCIVLADGNRRLCDCGSYETAKRTFYLAGLIV